MNAKIEILNKMVGKMVNICSTEKSLRLKPSQSVGIVRAVLDAETLVVDIPGFGEVNVSIWDIRQGDIN